MNLVNNANRDVFIGEIAKCIAREEEITIFGFAYLDNGTMQYCYTENEAEAFQIHHEKITLCPTPIESLTQRIEVTSVVKEQTKAHMQKILLQNYPEDYFLFLAHFNNLEPANQALPLLENYFDSFDLELTVDRQQANFNLVNFAYQAKQLNEHSYFELIKKSRYNKNTPLHKHVASGISTFMGIGYFQADRPITYYCNGYLPNVSKQKFSLEKCGYVVSPTLRKSYLPSDTTNFSMKDRKEDFTNILKQNLDRTYMQQVRDLKALPPAINQPSFYNRLAKTKLPPHAIKAIKGYAIMWNMSTE